MNTTYKSFKDVVDSYLCEQGFVCTYIGPDFVRFDNVYIDSDSNLLCTDIIVILSDSNRDPYVKYSCYSYKLYENSTERIPLPINNDILYQIDRIVKELQKHYWKEQNK